MISLRKFLLVGHYGYLTTRIYVNNNSSYGVPLYLWAKDNNLDEYNVIDNYIEEDGYNSIVVEKIDTSNKTLADNLKEIRDKLSWGYRLTETDFRILTKIIERLN